MSSNEVEEKDKGGRPPEGIKFGQHKNAFGWDPVGNKQLKQDFDVENQKTAFQPDTKVRQNRNTIKAENIIKYIPNTKTRKIITESLKSTEKLNTDSGTMLDENNIL
jgi:lipopolysaccharide export system protein LptA